MICSKLFTGVVLIQRALSEGEGRGREGGGLEEGASACCLQYRDISVACHTLKRCIPCHPDQQHQHGAVAVSVSAVLDGEVSCSLQALRCGVAKVASPHTGDACS